MPFKTRKHKTAAFGRRVNFIEGGLVSYRGDKFEQGAVADRTAKKLPGNSISIENSYRYVRSELVIISILAIIIIGLQLALKTFGGNFF